MKKFTKEEIYGISTKEYADTFLKGRSTALCDTFLCVVITLLHSDITLLQDRLDTLSKWFKSSPGFINSGYLTMDGEDYIEALMEEIRNRIKGKQAKLALLESYQQSLKRNTKGK